MKNEIIELVKNCPIDSIKEISTISYSVDLGTMLISVFDSKKCPLIRNKSDKFIDLDYIWTHDEQIELNNSLMEIINKRRTNDENQKLKDLILLAKNDISNQL